MGQRTWATLLSLVVLLIILSLNVVQSTQKTLVASNFAIYDQLKYLAPKDQKVVMLMPFGQDSHTFSPSPKNVTMIVDSVAFFYVSQGMDRWAEKLVPLKKASHGVDLSSSVTWIEAQGHDHEAEHHMEAEHEDHDAVDPHYWLATENQKATAKKIAWKLAEIFPEKKEGIMTRLDAYVATLDDLKQAYDTRLQSCKQSKLFVTHNAFSYLAKARSFHIESVVGLSPESTPNPTKMKKNIEKLKKNGVKTIFFESFSSNKIAKAIAHEVGIEIDVLDTLGTISAKDAKLKKSYSEIMFRNLDKIAKALECQ
jgi:zinc transport system substrate-binding protein